MGHEIQNTESRSKVMASIMDFIHRGGWYSCAGLKSHFLYFGASLPILNDCLLCLLGRNYLESDGDLADESVRVTKAGWDVWKRLRRPRWSFFGFSTFYVGNECGVRVVGVVSPDHLEEVVARTKTEVGLISLRTRNARSQIYRHESPKLIYLVRSRHEIECMYEGDQEPVFAFLATLQGEYLRNCNP